MVRKAAIVRAVWNGPFYAGLLAPPVSVGDVLLKVLETAWRFAILLILSAAVIGLGVFVWTVTIGRPLASQVRAVAFIDKSSCTDPRYPLEVMFNNTSSRTLGEIRFNIVARRKGYSSDLNQDDLSFPKLNYIVPAGKLLTWCWSLPSAVQGQNLSDIEFQLKVVWANEFKP